MNSPIPDDIVRIFKTYRRIRNEVILESGDPDNHYLLESDLRLHIEGPNRFYGKTDSGYVVEWYYGSPHKVHTPDGEYTYFRGNPCVPSEALLKKIDDRLAEELGLVLARELRYTTGPCGGEVGPYYKVVGTADFVVPEPSSPMLDGKEPDSNTKLNALASVLEALVSQSSKEEGP